MQLFKRLLSTLNMKLNRFSILYINIQRENHKGIDKYKYVQYFHTYNKLIG